MQFSALTVIYRSWSFAQLEPLAKAANFGALLQQVETMPAAALDGSGESCAMDQALLGADLMLALGREEEAEERFRLAVRIASGLGKTAVRFASGRRVHDRLVGLRLPMALVERYVPAGSLVQIIRTAPGLNDAEINFVGGSRFAIVAKAEEAMNARASVAQLQVELKPAVRELELRFASPPQEEPQKTNDDLMRSAWSPAEGLHVAETRDGVKYMLLEQTGA